MNRSLTMVFLVVVTIFAFSSSTDANCTQGFWKNHPENWCASPLLVGNVVYSQAELLDILNQPVEGNGLVALAHQLIAAKLNASCGSPVADATPAADALIGSLVIPPVGSGFLDPSVTSDLVDALDEYNNSSGFGLDLSKVEFFPSVSLGSVVVLLNELKKHGQKFVLIGLGPVVRDALAITRLDKLFEIHDSAADALAQLRRGQ